MPYTPDAPLTPHAPQTLPGTNTVVTRSFENRLLTAEFDDALVDQTPWKNPRYEGSKLIGKKINEFTEPETSQASIGTAAIGSSFVVGEFPIAVTGWEGDISIGKTPVISNETTALYIANTVIGGTEDNQFATIKNHSYVGISKILIVDAQNDTVQIVDKIAESFNVFNRFITNDFPTGKKCSIKIIDESISTNIKDTYRVKMNKGYLLKTLDFKFAGEQSGSINVSGKNLNSGSCLTENNSLYLYKGGTLTPRRFHTGSRVSSPSSEALNETIRFRYGVNEFIAAGQGTSLGGGDAENVERNVVTVDNLGPNYISSSIINNKFTQQYYTGSYGTFQHITDGNIATGVTTARQIDLIQGTAFSSASRFIGVDTLQFLSNNNDDTTLDIQDKTELHVTFFEGTKDFSSGSFDERSISTFEVDRNQSLLTTVDPCQGGLPRTHELILKGVNDTRFKPLTPTFFDDLHNGFFESTFDFIGDPAGDGCVSQSAAIPDNSGVNNQVLQDGISIDQISSASIFVQGGALGPIGYAGTQLTGSTGTEGYYNPLGGAMKIDNFYSGSFSYQLSFLDKDHTLILDLDKEAELFDGIGDNGIILIPDNCTSQVKNNIEFYLEKAGIIEKTTNTIQNLNYSTKR